VLGYTWGILPILPGSEVFDRLEEKVRFVPNILKIGTDLHTIARRKLITIQNLPARARVEIFDVTGQLVTEEFHNSVNDGVLSWFLTTFNDDGKMAPGIYFWRVTSLMPQSMGKTQKGTFLVIQ